MKPLMKLSIAGSTVVCAVLLSFSWSEQRGVSLSVDSAQAQQYGGGGNNQGGLVGGDDSGTRGFGRVSYGRTGSTGAAAVGTGAWGGPYYGAQASDAGGWQLVGGVMKCAPGTWIRGGHGGAFRCPGSASGPTAHYGANLVGGADSGIRRP